MRSTPTHPQRASTGRLALWAGLFLLVLGGVVPSSWAISPAGEAEDGKALEDGKVVYEQHCAKCHEGQVNRAPHRRVISRLPAAMVLRSLEAGRMLFQGMRRTNAERRAVAEWVTGKALPPDSAPDATVAGMCADAPGTFLVEDGAPQWNGWGVNNFNSRVQSAEQAGLTAEDVPQFKAKWVFGLHQDYRMSQPTVVGGRIFIGSGKGRVYSIDAKTGCLYWSIRTTAGVRATVVVDSLPGTTPQRYVAYFADTEANVYAVDAGTGKELWKVDVGQHPLSTITATPKTYRNRGSGVGL